MGLQNLGQKIANFFGEVTSLDTLDANPLAHEFMETNNLSDLLPYRLYDETTKIYENQTSYGFLLEVPPILGATSNMQAILNTLIKEIGEEGAAIQCFLWADPRVDPFLERWAHPREQKGAIYERLAQKKVQHFQNDAVCGDNPPRIFRFIFSMSLPKPHKGPQAPLIEKLVEKKKKAITAFSHLSHVHEPNPDDFLQILSGLFSSEQPTSVHKRRWQRDTLLSKQIGLPGSALEIENDRIVFHGTHPLHFKTYETIDFPDEWSMQLTNQLIGDFLNPSYRIPSPFYIHYGIHFPSQGKTEAKFQSKQKILEHQFKFPSIVKLFPNMPREREENLFVRRHLLEGEKFVETRLNLGLWGTPKDHHKSEAILQALYQKYGFKIKSNRFLHLIDFISSLPMSWGETTPYMKDLKRRRFMRTTLTTETSNFIPLVGEWWGNSQQGQILQGRRGQIASFDPFALEGNLNAVVVGPSGSGKSVYMQDLIMSELGQGSRVFVLDLGRSFEKLCYLLDGEYLFFNKESHLNLNPFNFIKGDSATDSALEMTTSIIATMAMPSQKIDKERADILSSLVKKAFDRKGKEATIDDVIDLIDQTSFNSELMKGATESLKEGLRRFGQNGPFKEYFYGKQEINFQSDLVVIETEELKTMADLQAVILQIFVFTISNEIFMGDREKRCLICIDEAWDLLKSPQMEGFIESMARRLRKYNGSLVIGTQSLKDFERSHGAKAAFQNSNWLMMLGNDTESINILKNEGLIPMDDAKERALSSLRKEDGKYSEVFIYHKGTGFYALNQLRLDPFSAALYSTTATDFQVIKELNARGYSTENALEWMLEHRDRLKELIQQGLGISHSLNTLIESAT